MTLSQEPSHAPAVKLEGAAHTPGPWIAEPGGGRGAWIKGQTGEWSALACGDTDETAAANARLIEAAPDLLAACQAVNRYALVILSAVDFDQRSHITEVSDAMRQARAAITKAVQS